MPDPAEDADLIHRYQAIEQAYCESRWREVLREGEKLLDELTRGDGESAEGLEQRLQLLLAHTHLYGFADRDAAEDHYSAVLRSRTDASLRQIATEGLARCNQPRVGSGEPTGAALKEPELPDPAPADEVPPATDAPVAFAPELTLTKPEPLEDTMEPPIEDTGSASLMAAAAPWQSDTRPAAAAPWLQAAGAATPLMASLTPPLAAELPRLVPEVLEEPEQIVVHQSLPDLADERVLEPIEPEPIEPEPVEPEPVELGPVEMDAAFQAEPAALDAPAEAAEAAEPPEALEALKAPAAFSLPEPAADEDPELVRALLRVQIR